MLKIFYLLGAVILTVLLLIIAFENVQAYCNFLVVFFHQIDSNTSPTFLIFGTAFIGFLTGFFYTSLFYSLMKKDNDENTDENSSPQNTTF